ncbi:DgyrCDS14412 [Dimorphilus gyrociliatus]|uniref:DgyrCDS14412 n=1 Tax=Dimorphilus gyrociliatus TaxID=2664684 RepID=A0A7I8WDH6_9ANNE|nr:DgyrCDS14412 [Dimorphilus gyrociliatus]
MNYLTRLLIRSKRIAYLPKYEDFLKTKSNAKRPKPVLDGVKFRKFKNEDTRILAKYLTYGHTKEYSFIVGEDNLETIVDFWFKSVEQDEITKRNFIVAEVDNKAKGFLKMQDFNRQEKALPVSEVFKTVPFFGAIKLLLTFWQMEIIYQYADESDQYLEFMVVDSNLRGKGIGFNLMKFAEYIAEQRGAKKMTLTVFSEYGDQLSLYKRLGYIITQEIQCPKFINFGYKKTFRMEKYL